MAVHRRHNSHWEARHEKLGVTGSGRSEEAEIKLCKFKVKYQFTNLQRDYFG